MRRRMASTGWPPTSRRAAVELTTAPAGHATAALLSARVLGIWGHHDSVAVICRDALAAGGIPGPAADSLEAELFANTMINAAASGEALERAQGRLASPGTSSAWRVNGALVAAGVAQPPGDALARLAPVLASGLRDVPPDSLTAVYALLMLIWSGELATASDICDTVLSAARGRGSMSMVAHASCLRSMIMRRIGRFDDAAADAALALDFKLVTSPPLAVAWAAALCIDALTCLGRLDDAAAVAAATAGREPPVGWIHTLAFLQARGALRVAQRRHAEALDDLLAAGEGWRALGIGNPAIASWRTEARAPLRRALDLAERTGAAPLAELARRELLAAGARPRRTALTGPDALTSAERRVAGLAADGLSNRQIAQHLFITQPTVETHLRHAFQKLGITSRAGLPAQLAGELPVPAGLPG
jgi:DNA-binding CsgD family transcriptional regulator